MVSDGCWFVLYFFFILSFLGLDFRVVFFVFFLILSLDKVYIFILGFYRYIVFGIGKGFFIFWKIIKGIKV